MKRPASEIDEDLDAFAAFIHRADVVALILALLSIGTLCTVFVVAIWRSWGALFGIAGIAAFTLAVCITYHEVFRSRLEVTNAPQPPTDIDEE